MNKDAIEIFDLMRMVQGETPMAFYLEIIVRGIFAFLLITGALRLMGKRMAGRLTRNELAAVATLAAGVGASIQSPERGLLPALLIALIVIMVQRLVARWSVKNERFERMTQGKITTLITDAKLEIKNMRGSRVSRERLFASLRNSQVKHLGEVQRLYLEANGYFTLIRRQQSVSGLSIIPQWDTEFNEQQPQDEQKKVCDWCGQEKVKAEQHQCPNCRNKTWTTAIH